MSVLLPRITPDQPQHGIVELVSVRSEGTHLLLEIRQSQPRDESESKRDNKQNGSSADHGSHG